MKKYYCPECKKYVKGVMSQNQIIGLVILFITLPIVGILYWLFCKKDTCPFCKSTLIIKNKN